MDNTFKRAPHNPPHWFQANTIYMLTASIYQGKHIIHSSERKTVWRNSFFEAAKLNGWHIIAWVVLNNHYHAMVESPENLPSLSNFIASYHKFTARQWNDEDYSFSSYKDYLEQQDVFDFTGTEEVNDVPEF